MELIERLEKNGVLNQFSKNEINDFKQYIIQKNEVLVNQTHVEPSYKLANETIYHYEAMLKDDNQEYRL